MNHNIIKLEFNHEIDELFVNGVRYEPKAADREPAPTPPAPPVPKPPRVFRVRNDKFGEKWAVEFEGGIVHIDGVLSVECRDDMPRYGWSEVEREEVARET